MNDLTLSKIQTLLPPTEPINKQDTQPAASPFSDYVKRSLADVNQKMVESDQAIDDLVTGRNQDIHNTMIAMKKAEISFELVLQIRNKLISAYDEIRRMSI